MDLQRFWVIQYFVLFFVVYCSTRSLFIVQGRYRVVGSYSYVVELLVVFVIAGTLLV